MTPIVRRIRPDEGLRLRGLRLRALADAPLAFGSTLAREEAFAEDVWQERAARGAKGEDLVTYVAEEGERWIGLATGILRDPDGPRLEPRLELVGMFVEPAARGRGVGAALVETVCAWARDRGMARLYLWVTSTNQAALPLYRRSGFRATGRSQPLDHTPSLSELEMVRDV
jgi:GNAT superfamily N-acetyltransferase